MFMPNISLKDHLYKKVCKFMLKSFLCRLLRFHASHLYTIIYSKWQQWHAIISNFHNLFYFLMDFDKVSSKIRSFYVTLCEFMLSFYAA